MKKYFNCLVILVVLLLASCDLFLPKSANEEENLFLDSYQPFSKNTRAVNLPEASTLKLTDNLPRIDGAIALYPLYATFVQAVYPEGKYSRMIYSHSPPPIVTVGTTPDAYSALINGSADIIFCAAPSSDQIETAREKGITFNLTPIGKEAFVFFVNRRNDISNLTTEQIRGIYSGRITNWSEVGGRKASIRAYQRPKNSGSQTMLEVIMGEEIIMKPITENAIRSMDGIITQTAGYKNRNNAIGYSFLFYTTQMIRNNEIKLLSVDGIVPSIETIQSGTYPYSDYFYAITTNTQNENVSRFIQWILSEQGQYLVGETGYVPLN
ncbi:MAG: substrate-binding domain-containing protein [Treponema sp.]|jgi:phosphate transport system substrate-binding protein|nr:substrate-binding domain-containing protein [Treponema sp.]